MAKWSDLKVKAGCMRLLEPKILSTPQVAGLIGCKECVTRRGNAGLNQAAVGGLVLQRGLNLKSIEVTCNGDSGTAAGFAAGYRTAPPGVSTGLGLCKECVL